MLKGFVIMRADADGAAGAVFLQTGYETVCMRYAATSVLAYRTLLQAIVARCCNRWRTHWAPLWLLFLVLHVYYHTYVFCCRITELGQQKWIVRFILRHSVFLVCPVICQCACDLMIMISYKLLMGNDNRWTDEILRSKVKVVARSNGHFWTHFSPVSCQIETYHSYSLPCPHDIDDSLKVMGTKVKVTDSFTISVDSLLSRQSSCVTLAYL